MLLPTVAGSVPASSRFASPLPPSPSPAPVAAGCYTPCVSRGGTASPLPAVLACAVYFGLFALPWPSFRAVQWLLLLSPQPSQRRPGFVFSALGGGWGAAVVVRAVVGVVMVGVAVVTVGGVGVVQARVPSLSARHTPAPRDTNCGIQNFQGKAVRYGISHRRWLNVRCHHAFFGYSY